MEPMRVQLLLRKIRRDHEDYLKRLKEGFDAVKTEAGKNLLTKVEECKATGDGVDVVMVQTGDTYTEEVFQQIEERYGVAFLQYLVKDIISGYQRISREAEAGDAGEFACEVSRMDAQHEEKRPKEAVYDAKVTTQLDTEYRDRSWMLFSVQIGNKRLGSIKKNMTVSAKEFCEYVLQHGIYQAFIPDWKTGDFMRSFAGIPLEGDPSKKKESGKATSSWYTVSGGTVSGYYRIPEGVFKIDAKDFGSLPQPWGHAISFTASGDGTYKCEVRIEETKEDDEKKS